MLLNKKMADFCGFGRGFGVCGGDFWWVYLMCENIFIKM